MVGQTGPDSDRSISIGQDVTDSVVISGDRNEVTFNKIIQISASVVQTHELIQSSPYKGLSGFGLKDKERFFGRDQLIVRLLDALSLHNFVLVLGASGSGKSSVVRAGVIHQLYQRIGPSFQHFVFTPDRDPFDSLYRCLRNPELDQRCNAQDAQIALESKPTTLMRVVQNLKPKTAQWLFFVDQFEELFTICQDHEKRQAFIDSLLQVMKSGDRSIALILAMRADFMDQLGSYPAFSELAARSLGIVGMVADMHSDELRQAIEQPAAQHGVIFENGLVDEIIKNVQGQAGYLPLLQYTLDLLWNQQLRVSGLQERTLTTRIYRHLGGVRGALQIRVEEIYNQFSTAEQLASARIFLKLVNIGGDEESGTDWRPVRRRANRSEFQDELERKVLDCLINEKLVVSDSARVAIPEGDLSFKESTVEIAHETLLTSWALLHHWIKENRQAIALRNRLNEDVELWEARDRSERELWGGARLEKVVELRQDSTFNQVLGGFNASANQFIDASVGLRDRYLKAEIERQRQQKILFQRIATGAFCGLTLVTGFAGIAAWQWRESELSSIRALTQASEARFITNRDTLDTFIPAVTAASQLQRLGWLVNDPKLEQQVTQLLMQAVNWVSERNRLEGHTQGVTGVSFSRDGSILVTGSEDGTVRLWKQNGEPLHEPLKGHADAVLGVSISPDGTRVASVGRDRTLKLWDVATGKLLQDLKQAHSDSIESVAFDSTGTRLATSSADKTVRVWAIQNNTIEKTPKLTLSGHTGTVRAVAFSPDGQAIASGTKTGEIILWSLSGKPLRPPFQAFKDGILTDIRFNQDDDFATAGEERGQGGIVRLWDRTGQKVQEYSGNEAGFLSVAFSPDGQVVVASDGAGILHVWHTNGASFVTLKRKTSSRINSLSFSPKGILAVGNGDNSVELWQVQSPWHTLLRGHLATIQGVAVDREGSIATASEDGTVRLWSADGLPLWTASHANAQVIRVSFQPQQDLVVSGDDQGMIYFWDHKTGTPLGSPLKAHDAAIYSISVSPNGKMMVTSSLDGTVKLWTLSDLSKPLVIPQQGLSYSSSFSADGSTLVTASTDGKIYFWNDRGKPLGQPLHVGSSVSAIAFHPNANLLVIGDQEGWIKLWDGTHNQIQVFGKHAAAVWGVSFNADGETLASASSDSTIKLWKLDGTLLSTLTGHIGNVNSVSFHPKDPQILVSGGQDSLGIRWILPPSTLPELLVVACQQVGDYLHTHASDSDIPRGMCGEQK